MPKASKVIRQFDGGLNTFSDARDVDDKTASEVKNFSIRNVGKLTPLGYFEAVSNGDNDNSATMSTISATDDDGSAMTIKNGAVFLPFGTDRIHGGTVGSEKWIAFVNRGNGKLWLHAHTQHINSVDGWFHPDPNTTDSPYGSAFAYGLPACLVNPATGNMTSGDEDAEAAYYIVDGALRVSDPNYVNATHIATGVSASSLWFGFIERTYIGDGSTNGNTANGWYTYPAVLVKPNDVTFKNSVTNTAGVGTGPDCDPGMMGINLEITRNKGDGTIQMQGRKLYVTYTFDGKQETLPHEIYTIASTVLPGAPTPADLGYVQTISKEVQYGDTSIGLNADVRDIAGTGDNQNWDESGTVTALDAQGQWQTLSYSDIVDGSGAYNNTNDATLTGVFGWVDYGECGEGVTAHTTESICDANEEAGSGHPAWLPSDLEVAQDIEYDPPGEIEELDENLGFRIALTIKSKATGANGEIIAEEYGGNRITHVNFYTNKYEDDEGTIPQETDYQYVCTFDLVDGFKNSDGTNTAWAAIVGTHSDQQICFSEYKGSIFPDTYQGRTAVFPDTKSIDIRWRTATVLNRRVYAGNVLMLVEGSDTPKKFGDRVMKSIPNRFDVFPPYDSLDVVVDDGDEIVLLESFGGILLQFKKETLYIIDVTTEPEFLRETYKYRGIPSQAAAFRTDSGIIFGNKYGAYLYDGQRIKQLCAGKIEQDWEDWYTDDIVIGYHPRYNLGIFTKKDSLDFFVYDLLTDSFVRGLGLAGSGVGGDRIGAYGKGQFFIYDNELIIPQENNDSVVTFARWRNDYSTATAAAVDYDWTSKDLDLGNPATIKRISKIKITYRTLNGDGNAAAYLIYNDGASTTQVQITSSGTDFQDTGRCAESVVSHTTKALCDADGSSDHSTPGENIWISDWETQDFKVTPAVKCLSTKLKIINDGTLDAGFEINDVTIVYRERPVK